MCAWLAAVSVAWLRSALSACGSGVWPCSHPVLPSSEWCVWRCGGLRVCVWLAVSVVVVSGRVVSLPGDVVSPGHARTSTPSTPWCWLELSSALWLWCCQACVSVRRQVAPWSIRAVSLSGCGGVRCVGALPCGWSGVRVPASRGRVSAWCGASLVAEVCVCEVSQWCERATVWSSCHEQAEWLEEEGWIERGVAATA